MIPGPAPEPARRRLKNTQGSLSCHLWVGLSPVPHRRGRRVLRAARATRTTRTARTARTARDTRATRVEQTEPNCASHGPAFVSSGPRWWQVCSPVAVVTRGHLPHTPTRDRPSTHRRPAAPSCACEAPPSWKDMRFPDATPVTEPTSRHPCTGPACLPQRARSR